MRNLWIVLCAAMCFGCSRHASKLRHSNGSAYSATVVAEDSAAAGIIKGVLETYVTGLPQLEPSFDVTVARELNGETCTKRNIVMVTTGKSRFASTDIKYKHDVYAEPQLLIHVTTPSAEMLKADMNTSGDMLLALLENAEMSHASLLLRKAFNKEQAKVIGEMFGVDLLVPKNLTHSKRGKDFIWLSNNAASGMQNICIYTVKDRITDGETFTHKRDSIMRANIPGEHQGMWMATVKGSEEFSQRSFGKDTMLIAKGLWEMKGDMMGGPFVAHIVNDQINGRTIVAEAFVYAPDTNKRNQIRQLEAALYTLLYNIRKDNGE